MAQVAPVKLRIYCICGQKMKVSPSMYGRPGKCIACRQKIRIPKPKEIEAGVTEVYLKDHPEFLRKSRAAKAPGKARPLPESADFTADTDEDLEAVELGDTEDERESIPLDVLESLQLLCSFEYVVQRQLEAYRGRKKPKKVNGLDKATLMNYRALVHKARTRLDEELRRHLHKAVEQLATAEDQIARATVSVRVGEKDYSTFARTVLPLRQLRERLERRAANLRGWIAVNDAFLAGGLLDVRLEDVPTDPLEVHFDYEAPTDQGMVDQGVSQLRAALANREEAERKLAEWLRMEKEGALSGAALAECHGESDALRRRAQAAVAFGQARLEQVAQDCDNDIRAIKAQLESAREHFDKGDLDETAYQNLEMELLRGQSDNTRARDLARRALHAANSSDVPRLQGTFLRRMAHPAPTVGLGPDSVIAWTAAALMILNIIVPISESQLGRNMVVMPGFAMGLFLVSVILAIAGSIPMRQMRGLVITGIWTLACLAAAAYIHETRYGLSGVGGGMRSNPMWYLRPGILLLLFCGLLTGAAAAVSLFPFRGLRQLPLAAAVVIVTGMSVLLTDAAGILLPRPYLLAPDQAYVQSDVPYFDVTVTVGNQGWRTLWLGGRLSKHPFPATLVLERRIGSESWEDMSLPDGWKQSDRQWWTTRAQSAFPTVELAPGKSAILRYTLPAGAYKITLRGRKTEVENFVLDPPVDVEPAFENDSQEEAAPEDLAPQEPAAPPGATVELIGIIDANDRPPRFHVSITFPNGASTRRSVALGETIYDEWTASEYSPARNTLTLGNGERLLAFSPGEVLRIETAEAE